MLLDLVRFARYEDQTLPVLLMVLSVGVAGEMLIDVSGNNALVALLFAMLRCRPVSAARPPSTTGPEGRFAELTILGQPG
jgi:hypothetical protein